jgi:hypothetical protein
MSEVIKKCSVFGCESREVVRDDKSTYEETEDALYICSDCMAVASIFCRDQTNISKETSNHVLVRVDSGTVRAVCTDTDDGVFR